MKCKFSEANCKVAPSGSYYTCSENGGRGGELSDHIGAGRMKIEVEINQHGALEDAMQAHKDLEAREMTSSSVI
ncbi:hypothetical protein CBM2592_B40103 [Cupriavidus taiwanensis]|uniref:hypothetical protein n=1 Tax=Cupriavidus taiwanensis TaxID=164546 RepID=UPI000E106DB1|nr:hypothetical protein CBM2592_B40103 [Cupriavidus taiwanensis]SOY70648.1 hypothetical protein CBM2588_B30103 [Cupriavidus taiwanensis]SOY95532.1 hypothetical protein CBM2591_B20103 [Cupriavidus taiwanensis]SOZ74321.1 hypothetical protein CBM2617_B60013 [Cupriavidus taiwanensis]SOZ88272.1 hypothetical protein CBM2618_B50016 [Cupriavidus taiwanensis]